MNFCHSPVMLKQCVDALAVKPGGIYVDGTAGGAGHSAAIAKLLKNGHLYAMDQDPSAVLVAKQRLSALPATVIKANFADAENALLPFGSPLLDGVLLDLGVSSHQLDEAERGFSYMENAPLDMRMSQSGTTAAQLVQSLTRQELADILRMYGEEAYAWQIAGKIVLARGESPILTTGQLANIIISAVPPAVRRKNKNPAKKSFQAIRIAVNKELEVLSQGLCTFFEMLKPGGRLAVITFHSLEDRIVKQQFRQWATACTCPPQMPVCVCKGRARAVLLGTKPQIASQEEQEENRRSKSAKLRVIEKI